MRKLMLAVVVALTGVGALAAISLGDEGSTRSDDLDRAFERVVANRVDPPSPTASATGRASAKRKPKVKYFETRALEVRGREDVFTRCPRKHKALSGYFRTSGGIVLDISAISEDSRRAWVFGLVALDQATQGEASIGVVCGKRL